MIADTLDAMLKWSRKKMLQRKHKPMAKHASETFAAALGVGFDESRDVGQAVPCARDHVNPQNSDADSVCCDSEPTPNMKEQQ